MQTLVLSKQPDSEGTPAMSNKEIYAFIYGKKPPGKLHKLWLKKKRLFKSDQTWMGSSFWKLAGGISLLLIAASLLFAWNAAVLQHALPLQLGAVSFFCLFLLSKRDKETQLFKLSGILAILAAVALPVLVLNLYSSWQAAALFLPAQLAICGMAALYRSNENLEPYFIFYKALSYLVATLLTGWLSYYCLTNL